LDKIKEYIREYPNAGYSGQTFRWGISDSRKPYNSFGNGAGMRVSPVGFAYNTLEEVLGGAKKSAEVTHSHPEGIKGAQAVASAIFLARKGEDRLLIRRFIQKGFGYDLSRSIDDIRPTYEFDVTCQGSVPQAITAALESEDFEDAVRKAVSLGGDSDTLACMAGGIAQALYGGVPDHIKTETLELLDDRLRDVVFKFSKKYSCE
ncbi:MAG TPA: ADP-ribosylglycohydrolase family protein, partial [archaeon]|nr:ADP-ribosylglycohydrolase family protein [archaeon]